MLLVADKSSVQGKVVWKIKNKDILEGKRKITYISPGGYSFWDKKDRLLHFDWQDSESSIINDTIVSELYSLDYCHINDMLKEEELDELIKEEHRLEFFKDFKRFEEVFCFTDIDEEEVDINNDLECIYFELFDPISNQVLMLIGECETKLKPEEIYERK